MLMDQKPIEGARSDASQQFQTDQAFLREWRHGELAISLAEGEPLTELGDISLAMRQFYQSPGRSTG